MDARNRYHSEPDLVEAAAVDDDDAQMFHKPVRLKESQSVAWI